MDMRYRWFNWKVLSYTLILLVQYKHNTHFSIFKSIEQCFQSHYDDDGDDI